jgi:hypothetical protein
MRRLLATVLALALAGFPVFAGERLPGSQIDKTFAGVTLDGIYEDGTFFTETYFDDGSIRYHDVNRSDSGEWSVRGDTFCTFYEDQSGACFFVERDGDNCFTFFEAVEESGGRKKAAEWTSRGWNRDREATCKTPPEAEI